MVSLGNFDYTLTISNQSALAAMAAVQIQATRLYNALQGGSGGGGSRVNIDTSPAIRQLEALGIVVKETQRIASFTAVPKVDTTAARAEISKLQELATAAARGLVQGSGVGSGFLFGAGAGVGAIGALGVATAVSKVTQALTGGISAGIQYRATLETTTNTFEHYTGSAQRAAAAIDGLRKLATISPFGEQPVLTAGATFLRTSGGDVERMQQLVTLTTALAAAHPERGFEEMQAAIQQLISGDYRAFEDRTNITFGTVKKLEEQGFTGMELYRKAVEAAGGSTELLEKNADTLTARLTTFESAVQKAQGLVAAGFASQLQQELPNLTKSINDNAAAWSVLGASIAAIPGVAIQAAHALATASGGAVVPRGPNFNPNNPLVPLGGPTGPKLDLLPQRGTSGTPQDLAALLAKTPGSSFVEDTSKQAAATAEAAKALASAQAEARQVELSGIQATFAAESAAVKASEQAQIKSINTVKDAAIEAAGARRDAAVAGLDAEVQARSRARTLQDRDIAAANQAILDGLEKQHQAQLKGLDEQLTAIQKRGDAALKELDQEQTAEDTRHTAALRNINAERDAKLAIVDASLKQLNAEVDAHRNARTDRQEQQALADAQKQLHDAKTPAERAAARNAIARAQDAINEEQYNRGAEARRAKLAADAEAARTAATTATATETDTHAAEDKRIADLVERVKTETKIEAESIADRVKAENDGYQQTVKDQQAAFTAQKNALDDQRYAEDQAIAARRTAISTAYDNDTADAKKSAADRQKAEEELTRATLEEIDKRRRAAERALLPPVPIAGGQQPGLPPTHAGGPALGNENAGQGTGEPPSRGNIPSQSAALVESFRFTPEDVAAVQQIGKDAAAGFAAGAASTESQTAVKNATITLIDTNVIVEAQDLLGTHSPSTVFAQIGADTAQGFVNGYQTVDIFTPARKPFEDLRDWLVPGLADIMTTAGGADAAAWSDAYTAADLYAVGRSPFEQLNTWLEGEPELMSRSAQAAAASYANGWIRSDPGSKIYRDGVYDLLTDFQRAYPSWFAVGQNSAQSFVNGFGDVLANWQPFGGSSPSSNSSDGLDLGSVVGHAGGGRISARDWSLVGERGPELVRMTGDVLPADVSANLMAAASGRGIGGGSGGVNTGPITINLTANGAQDPAAFVQQVGGQIAEEIIWHFDQAHRNQSDRVSKVQAGAD